MSAQRAAITKNNNTQNGAGVGMTLSWAEFVSYWANWILVGALITGVLATVGIVVSANIKEAFWEREREFAKERLSANEAQVALAKKSASVAQAQGEAARAQAATANQAAAEANKIAAAANERAAATTLELEKYQAPRSIRREQEAILSASLVNQPRGQVYVIANWTDPEAKTFKLLIDNFLKEENFTVSDLTGGNVPITFGRLGAFFAIKDANKLPSHLTPLVNAFRNAGFQFDLIEGEYVPDNSVVIGISTKQ